MIFLKFGTKIDCNFHLLNFMLHSGPFGSIKKTVGKVQIWTLLPLSKRKGRDGGGTHTRAWNCTVSHSKKLGSCSRLNF